jgi:glycosyltransferase involved in cell wall biosynthesis
MKRVSFIVAAYNAESTIIELIQSLEKIASADDEIVICDDASEDETWTRLNTYQSSIPMKILRNSSNSGRASSRNAAIEVSSGGYVAVFDADDLALPSALEPLCTLDSDTKFVMASSQTILYSRRLGYWINSKYPTDPEEIKNQFSMGMSPMSHGGTIIRKSIFQNSGLYNPEYVRAQDFDLLRRISSLGEAKNLSSYGYLYKHNVWLRYSYWKQTKQSRNIILARPQSEKINRVRWFGMNCRRVIIALGSKRQAIAVARELGLK